LCHSCESPAHLAHALLNEIAVAVHARGATAEGGRKNCGEPRGVVTVEAPGRRFEVKVGGCVGAVDAGSPFDDVEIELKNALLAENEFGDWNENELGAFAQDGAARSEEEVFDELLSDGRGTATAGTFEVVFGGDLDLVPIEAMVLVEAGVLGGNDGVLEFGRDLLEWNEAVALVIRTAVDECLKAALRLNGGCGRVDPAKGDEGEGGEGPGERESDYDSKQERSQPNGSEAGFPRAVFGG
jgi:hypothetical protein